jgi:hypothetical protein
VGKQGGSGTTCHTGGRWRRQHQPGTPAALSRCSQDWARTKAQRHSQRSASMNCGAGAHGGARSSSGGSRENSYPRHNSRRDAGAGEGAGGGVGRAWPGGGGGGASVFGSTKSARGGTLVSSRGRRGGPQVLVSGLPTGDIEFIRRILFRYNVEDVVCVRPDNGNRYMLGGTL